MSQENICPEATFKAGDQAHGFQITRVTPVQEVRATAYEAVHLATGARFLHLHCPDRENYFAVTFRTPPPDSTGVPHILEHSVLAGSKKYPVKDAFNELGKGSLKTFLNAFTAPDFTCYPVASQVPADFYNLASVYTDLVFRPLLTRNTFMQEGHHLEVEGDGELSISGIVYNEMKGAFSTPEAVAERATINALLPDTPYGVDSGGHPDHIPDLTYEGFCEFHRRYYSPSNAWIFCYGDLPTGDHLQFLAGQLTGFRKIEVDSGVPDQPRWTAPRVKQDEFPISEDDAAERRAVVNVAWLTAGVDELEDRLILQVLEEALVGNAGSPLRKALIDSGLGEDLSPTTGLQTWFRQLPFVVGLRGTDSDQAAEIENLACSTLRGIADTGLPRDLLEAAFHQVEFKGLEITRSSYIFPLILMFRVLGTWLHGQDPLVPLRFPTLMSALRRRWEKEPDLFNRSLRHWLVENPHRLRTLVTPSRTLAAESEAKVRTRLMKLKSGLRPAELEEIRRTAEGLREAQRAPESPEALATLPALRLDQIPREVEVVPTRESRIDSVQVLEHALFTNGIAYVDIAFDVSDVLEELQPLLPYLAAAATGMGAGGDGYEVFATRKDLVTGGVSMEVKARDHLAGGEPVQILVLHASALERNIDKMVELVGQILLQGDLSDLARLKDVLSEERNDLRASVAPRGHLFSWMAAASSLSLAAHRDEQWHGVSQVRFLNDLVKRFDAEVGRIAADLGGLREMIFRRRRAVINLTADETCLGGFRKAVEGLILALPPGKTPAKPKLPELKAVDPGVTVPGNVCYVARVLPAPKYSQAGAPVTMVLANHLGDGVLYQRIRVEGGAYGGMAVYNPNLGQFAMLSYRDPNLEKTVEVYDGCLEEFFKEELSADEVRKAIIGTVSGLDRPMDPATRGFVALERMLIGLTDAARQRFRDEVLTTTAASMREGARTILLPALPKARQAVLAPRERVEAANAVLSRPFEITGLE